jgi:hypothetical protein
VEEVIEWACRRFSELTGLRYTDLLMAVVRLARDESLEGRPHQPEYGLYGEGRPDLSHVAAPLHELDRDGSTAHLWRQLCRRWPIFGKAQRMGARESGSPALAVDQQGAPPSAPARAPAAGQAAAAAPETRSAPPTRSKRPKATVNARMLETIQANSEALGWNSRQWAEHLRCGKPAVVATPTWKSLELRREQARAQRALDRRRKPKASDRRHD